VDDPGALVDGPLDASHDVGNGGGTGGRHGLGHHQLGVGGDPGDADAVAPHGGDDPSHVGPVAVVVLARTGAARRAAGGADAVRGGDDLARQILVEEVDSGVDDADPDPGAGRAGPRL